MPETPPVPTRPHKPRINVAFDLRSTCTYTFLLWRSINLIETSRFQLGLSVVNYRKKEQGKV
ncbi:hypothetical protein CVT26_001013 [Gymnopilus dilepis]|uniref:Uncharacterized protein n=1 Tax=Gymnopilus dilepis TaxID=231916 RepID=A0A409Y2A2_9AGAR|nr:hypothetical protein CVT26_001013 [Gymnopilus dilepis]